MKRIFVFAILSLTFLFSAYSNAGALGKGQRLACEAIMCAIGIAIPESHNECRKVLIEWSAYSALLGPFASKPKCPKVDENQNVVGEQEVRCDDIQDAMARQQCHEATDVPEDCSRITDRRQRMLCEQGCDPDDILTPSINDRIPGECRIR